MRTLPLVLLTSPPVCGRLNDCQSNGLARRDIEPLGDNQKLLRVTLQRRVSKALAGATVQESFSSFCKRTCPVPGGNDRIPE